MNATKPAGSWLMAAAFYLTVLMVAYVRMGRRS